MAGFSSTNSRFIQPPAATVVAGTWALVNPERIVEHGIAPTIIEAASVDEKPATGPLLPGQLAFIRSRGAGQLQRAAAFIGGESGAAIQAHGLSSRKLQAASKDDKDGASADIPASRALVPSEHTNDDEGGLTLIMQQAQENVRRRWQEKERAYATLNDGPDAVFPDNRVRMAVRRAIQYADAMNGGDLLFESWAIKIVAEQRAEILRWLEQCHREGRLADAQMIEDAAELVMNDYVYPKLVDRIRFDVPKGTRESQKEEGLLHQFVSSHLAGVLCELANHHAWVTPQDLDAGRQRVALIGDFLEWIEPGFTFSDPIREVRHGYNGFHGPPQLYYRLNSRDVWDLLERRGLLLPGSSISLGALIECIKAIDLETKFEPADTGYTFKPHLEEIGQFDDRTFNGSQNWYFPDGHHEPMRDVLKNRYGLSFTDGFLTFQSLKRLLPTGAADTVFEKIGLLIYRSLRRFRREETPLVPGTGAYERTLSSIVEALGSRLPISSRDIEEFEVQLQPPSRPAAVASATRDDGILDFFSLKKYEHVRAEIERMLQIEALNGGPVDKQFAASLLGSFSSPPLLETWLQEWLHRKRSRAGHVFFGALPFLDGRKRLLKTLEKELRVERPIDPAIKFLCQWAKYWFDVYQDGEARAKAAETDEELEEGEILMEAARIAAERNRQAAADKERSLTTGRDTSDDLLQLIVTAEELRKELGAPRQLVRALEEKERLAREVTDELNRHPDDIVDEKFRLAGITTEKPKP